MASMQAESSTVDENFAATQHDKYKKDAFPNIEPIPQTPVLHPSKSNVATPEGPVTHINICSDDDDDDHENTDDVEKLQQWQGPLAGDMEGDYDICPEEGHWSQVSSVLGDKSSSVANSTSDTSEVKHQEDKDYALAQELQDQDLAYHMQCELNDYKPKKRPPPTTPKSMGSHRASPCRNTPTRYKQQKTHDSSPAPVMLASPPVIRGSPARLHFGTSTPTRHILSRGYGGEFGTPISSGRGLDDDDDAPEIVGIFNNMRLAVSPQHDRSSLAPLDVEEMMRLAELEKDDGDNYEQLWDLAERIGDVKNPGLTYDEVQRLPTQTAVTVTGSVAVDGGTRDAVDGFTSVSNHDDEDQMICRVCQDPFLTSDSGSEVKLRILPCFHRFHQICIDKWLLRKALCPICRIDVKESLTKVVGDK